MRTKLAPLAMAICLLLGSAVYGKPKEQAAAAPFRPALLVIDIQNEYLPMMDQKDVQPGLAKINELIGLFRARGYPIIRVYHTEIGVGPKPGSAGFAFPPSIQVQESDPMVVKNHPSAFVQTGLDKLLREKKCSTLYLAGLSAVGCVLATYFGAVERGYETFMVGDALISHNAEFTGFVRRIVASPPLAMVALHLKALSAPVGKMADLSADTLKQDYGVTTSAPLNNFGYFLLQKGRLADALVIFKVNVRLFPDEPNVYDSLGEALERDKQPAQALACYEKAYQKAREKNDPQLGAFEKNYTRLKGTAK